MKSEKERADVLLRGIREELAVHSNLGAYLLALSHEKRGVQHRVLDALGARPGGRPRNPISDEEWLLGVESWRQHMKDSGVAQATTDLEVIEHWLKNTDTRNNRPEGEPFRPQRPAGKDEIKRIRDVIVRARRNRKNPPV